jgi:hypothetical protein
MPDISTTPTFSPILKSDSRVPRKISVDIPMIAAANIEEDTRMKNRYGCLRENIDFFFK